MVDLRSKTPVFSSRFASIIHSHKKGQGGRRVHKFRLKEDFRFAFWANAKRCEASLVIYHQIDRGRQMIDLI